MTEGHDTIEIHEAEGAFELLEGWLRERGFFAPGGEDLVADLYLGYGLSSTIRRRHSSAPPEPCPLPLAACAVRPPEYVVSNDNPRDDDAARFATLSFGHWQHTWAPNEYAEAVERVRDAIRTAHRAAPDLENVRGTRWGALQAVAAYVDYAQPTRQTAGRTHAEARFERATEPQPLKDKALELLTEGGRGR